MAVTDKSYAIFDVKQSYLRFEGETKAVAADCTGKLQHELTSTVGEKKCGQAVIDTITKGLGEGTGTLSAYLKNSIRRKMYGLASALIKENIDAYGQESVHGTFALTCVVTDEKNNEVLIAYPKVVVTDGPKLEVEHKQTEVNADDYALKFLPDSLGHCFYSIPVADLPTGLTKEKWLTEFDLTLVSKTSA